MITIQDVSIQFTGENLFENVSLKINYGDRIALAGSNGTGKSTLLKMIAGLEEPSSGNIYRQKNITSGYLPQEFINKSKEFLFDEVRNSIRFITDIEESELRIQSRLREKITEDESQKLLAELGDLSHTKEHKEYYAVNSKIEKILEGLGFSANDFMHPVIDFSGGWQMRIELAKILMGSHSIILLDEPTNHLDIDSLQWLIGFLSAYKGSLILVSHDRHFLNKLTDKTIEIFNKKLTFFNGNYDHYLKMKDERDELIIAQFKNQEKKIAQIEKFIERFRYKATKARQVQSRIKQIDKIEKINLPEFEKEITLSFPEPPASGITPVNLINLCKSYGKLRVLENVNFTFERGDKVAFLGPNGAGKTTLSKILAAKLDFESGKVDIGHNVHISYYAQEVADNLNMEDDIIDVISQTAPDLTLAKIRSLLGSFLFSDDDVFKKIKVLSGGEKSRVALAKILVTKANFIILDEPTNHLDYNSKLVLQKALVQFNGTLVIVSHDIDFLRPIANKILEIRKLKYRLYAGGIDYYLHKRKEYSLEKDQTEILPTEQMLNKKDQKRIEAELRQKKYTATKYLKEKVAKLEDELESLEKQKSTLEKDLMCEITYKDPQLAKSKKNEFDLLKSKLETIYRDWSSAVEELEKIESQFC